MKKALTIGIDKYPIEPLNGCVNDATRMAEVLREKTCNFEVHSVFNESATRAQLRREIGWCLSEADFSVIYFAGHGVRTDVATFLATSDYEDGDEGIDFSWLQSAITRLSKLGQTCILILDCCHSGDASVRSLTTRIPTMEPSDIPLFSGVGRVLLAACRGDELANEVQISGEMCGLFSHHLCNAIEGFAANDLGLVTVNAAYDYVASKLESSDKQVPIFKGDQEGQIVFASKVAKKGVWNQKIATSILTPTEATAKAENLLSQLLPKTAPVSHSDWQRHGYKDACKAFEPVHQWFQRRLEAQPDLRGYQPFNEKYQSSQQICKSLNSVTPGMVIPQGKVGDPLGTGTFGTVFRIDEVASNTPMCFKVYHAHDLFEAHKVGRFKRGHAAMKQLDHPNIVKVKELSEIPLGFFMDYIEGANSRHFNPATQEPEIVVNLLLEVAETLQHAHGRGVVHRDVKPENILIRIDDGGLYSAYLTDFDLSWFSSATQVTKLAEGFGSHFYAAPEQINSPNAAIAHRPTVDTYSFGQLCFFFVAGRDPLAFNSNGNAIALEQELSRRWTDSSAASEMSRLYRDCVFQAADKRIADFRVICERLAQMSLILESPDAEYDTETFLTQAQFTLSGDMIKMPVSKSSTTFRSRSGRTDVSISAVTDGPTSMGVDVTFRPDNIVMEGRSSQEARTKVNSRIDAMLMTYAKSYETRRSGAKSGAFEITVRINHLKKERRGVAIAREIIARIIDQIEQT